MYCIVGLGNPEETYKNTRHNFGKEAVEAFATSYDFSLWKKTKHNDLYAEGVVEQKKILLLKPQTFMNLSGTAVNSFLNYYEYSTEELIVVHDDIDIPFGSVQISYGKSAGGHRGVSSIIENIQSKNFTRVRIGISPISPHNDSPRPSTQEAVASFVTATFSSGEKKQIPIILKEVSRILFTLIVEGRERAMTQSNASVL